MAESLFIGIVILAPLLAALLILVLRRRIYQLAIFASAISLLFSVLLLSGNGGDLVFAGLPNMPLQLIATPLTSLLSTLVGVVSFLVMIYATGYMAEDKEKKRFFATLLFFIAAMHTLVLAGDWILLLSAWELIGFSSYLLIGFWYQKTSAKKASSKAFLVTRSADLGLYLAVFILIANSGSSDIATTLNSEGSTAIIAGILLLIAAMGKSAQTPFHDWLQQAMAGPTPVSALLHSATLVAAGAILLIRTAPMLPTEVLLVIGTVGGITALITGLIALAETDLKRLLAASTSSQYGLMLLAVGAGVPMAALLHLIAHAAIKSSLFLGAGIFQHSKNTTSLSELKGIGRSQPRIFIGFSIAALALAGIPPLSGFFSKDAIIAATMTSTYAWLFMPLALLGTILTGAYMARALRILWHGESHHKKINGLTRMVVGLAGLVALVVTLGLAFPGIEIMLAALVQVSPDSNQSTQYSENGFAEIIGLTAAITGLLLGWFMNAQSLMGPLVKKANQGFSILGGFDKLCVSPAFAIASYCNKIELKLYAWVIAAGKAGMKLGQLTQGNDEKRIDYLIFSIVKNTIRYGGQARSLQSGLIHKELAITMIVTAALVIATIFWLLIF